MERLRPSVRTLVLGASIAALAVGCRAGKPAPAMSGANPAHTGVYDVGSSPHPEGRLKWRRHVGATTGPTVASGLVFVGDTTGGMTVLDAETGAERGRRRITGGFESVPAWAGGVLYFGHCDHLFRAVDPRTLTDIWTFAAEDQIQAAPVLSGGVAYVGSIAGDFYAINLATRRAAWQVRAGSSVRKSAATDNGLVFVPVESRRDRETDMMLALNAADGTRVWSFPTEFWPTSPTAAYGLVYFGDGRSTLYALDARNGTERWRFEAPARLNEEIFSAPVVDNGLVYCATGGGIVHALDAKTGEAKWKLKPGERITYRMALAGGRLYVGVGATLSAVDAVRGELLWSFRVGSDVVDPVVVDGVVYFSTWNEYVYALR